MPFSYCRLKICDPNVVTYRRIWFYNRGSQQSWGSNKTWWLVRVWKFHIGVCLRIKEPHPMISALSLQLALSPQAQWPLSLGLRAGRNVVPSPGSTVLQGGLEGQRKWRWAAFLMDFLLCSCKCWSSMLCLGRQHLLLPRDAFPGRDALSGTYVIPICALQEGNVPCFEGLEIYTNWKMDLP